MSRTSRRRVIKGRVVQVDILPSEGGLVLSVGPLSLWLALEDVGDLTETLARALEIESEEMESGRPARPRRLSRSRKHRVN